MSPFVHEYVDWKAECKFAHTFHFYMYGFCRSFLKGDGLCNANLSRTVGHTAGCSSDNHKVSHCFVNASLTCGISSDSTVWRPSNILHIHRDDHQCEFLYGCPYKPIVSMSLNTQDSCGLYLLGGTEFLHSAPTPQTSFLAVNSACIATCFCHAC